MSTSRERVTSDEAQIQSTEALLNTAYQQAMKNQMVANQYASQMQMEGLETLYKGLKEE